MKGLITKDFCLMFQRKRSFIILIICGVAMSFSMDASFLMGWMTVVGAMFAISTIAYDEYDNCYPFLMTLPISRKGYALEKYLFGAITAFGFWLAGLLIYLIMSLAGGVEADPATDVPAFLMLLLIPLVILDFSVPFDLKFGPEKGRIYMLIAWGVIFAAGFVLIKFVPSFSFNPAEMTFSIAAFIVFVVAATVASLIWSIRIMQAKEF